MCELGDLVSIAFSWFFELLNRLQCQVVQSVAYVKCYVHNIFTTLLQ